ncbi:MAG: hypothetical protein CM15mP54_20930 [Paracoccaceae bacterium]|nr:MAG: hypothetical protein CM15mP54_20930 [Paracoccaceae bacterium]
MFGNSSGRTNVVSIRAGTVDQTDIINPMMNVFVDSKISSTPMNNDFRKQVKCLTADSGKRINPHPNSRTPTHSLRRLFGSGHFATGEASFVLYRSYAWVLTSNNDHFIVCSSPEVTYS